MFAALRRLSVRVAGGLAVIGAAIVVGPSIPWASGDLVAEILRGVELGWSRTPAIAIGIASALSVPFLARLTPTIHALLVPDRSAAQVAARRAHMLSQPSRSFLTKAWLEGDGTGNRRVELAREIVRIGHGPDADVRLPGKDSDTVLALIRRTPEAEFVVMDMSGGAGLGLTVNGQRLITATLCDSDQITFGASSIVFRRG